MITIDGQQSQVKLTEFTNLEEILVHIRNSDVLNTRIITEVLINGELFSEIYPHQAEDIANSTINTLDIVSVSTEQMTIDIIAEMYKVVDLIRNGSMEISRLYREAEDETALELLQDLLDVIRDFRKMQDSLEISLSGTNMSFEVNDAQLNELLIEMNEVLRNEDWILLADLFEYEFVPFCDKWKAEVDILKGTLAK